MSEEIKAIEKSNPTWTYGMCVGYSIGKTAQALGDIYMGLSKREWQTANDDYAVGYRRAIRNDGPQMPPTGNARGQL